MAAIRLATEMGASPYVALYRIRIAHVLVAQGRDEDALVELERARETSADAAPWKSARARILARRGETDEAVRLAREAEGAMAESDNITSRAEILVDLAEVLRASGDLDGASAALVEAVSLHEEKGNVLNAQQCLELLAGIEPARAR